MIKNLIILSVALISLANADIESKQLFRCPEVTVPDSFDLTRYIGLWYEAEKYPFIWSINTKCVTAEYGQNADGSVTVANKNIGKLLGLEISAYGTARIVGPGKLSVSFPMTSGREAPYWVLETDYDNYAVVFSCSNGLPKLGSPNVWILTRSRNPDQAILDKAYAVLDANKLSKRLLIKTDQTGCLN